MTPLIGFVGRARVGKDTATSIVRSDYGFESYAFADPLKEMLTSVFGPLFNTGDREKEIDWLGKSPRQLMQTLGTEWGRDLVHPNLWVLLADRHYRSVAKRCGRGLVVSDVRFPNEAEWVRKNGGTLIEIRRPEAGQVNAHVSEQHEIEGDVIILNNGSLHDFYQALVEEMQDILGATGQAANGN